MKNHYHEPISHEELGKEFFNSIKRVNDLGIDVVTKEDFNKTVRIGVQILDKHLAQVKKYAHFEQAEEALKSVRLSMQLFLDVEDYDTMLKCLRIDEEDLEEFKTVYESAPFLENVSDLLNAILQEFYYILDLCGIMLEYDLNDLMLGD